MKKRPRSVENKVAAAMQSVQRLYYPDAVVSRIPVLGRTGPDITLGPMGIAVDVKSRLSISKNVMAAASTNLYMDHGGQALIGCRLQDFSELLGEGKLYFKLIKANKTLISWWEHMNEWSLENMVATSAIVVHIPGERISFATIWLIDSQLAELRKLEKL